MRLRAASLHGAAIRAEAAGADEKAYDLLEQTFSVLDGCANPKGPDVLAIRITAVVLLDKVAQKLKKMAPVQRLSETLGLVRPFAGSTKPDEAIAWLVYRLKELQDHPDHRDDQDQG
jgi:hypothetical protein